MSALAEVVGKVTAGANVPDVVFKTRSRIESSVDNPFDWKDVTTNDLFKGACAAPLDRPPLARADSWIFLFARSPPRASRSPALCP